MDFLSFENPVLLVLIPFAIAAVYLLARKNYANLPRARWIISIFARCLGVLLLLLALSAPELVLPSGKSRIVYLLDVSASVDDAARVEVLDKIAAIEKEKSSGTKSALVLFAGKARIAVPATNEKIKVEKELREKILVRSTIEDLKRTISGPAPAGEVEKDDARVKAEEKLAALEKWKSEIDVEDTDYAAAVALARGLFSGDEEKKVVLFSDCAASSVKIEPELSALRNDGAFLAAFRPRLSNASEVIARSMIVPAEARKMQPFDAEVHVSASESGNASVVLYRNKFLVGKKEVRLKKGDNAVVFKNLALREGFHELEARVTSGKDTLYENNAARAAILVKGKPRVLYIEGDEEDAHYLEGALEMEEIEVDTRPASGVPTEMNELLNYDVLILSNVPAPAVPPSSMRMIEQYVEDMGGGFFMLGGDESFGLGGYYNTPIERILPVKMPVKKKIEKPEVAICLLIDRSGSMTGEKIELAKQAALASAEVLKDNNRIAVVAFDEKPYWVVKFVYAGERGKISDKVSALRAGGGTNIYPALKLAKRALDSETAKIKHVILLSDGQTMGRGYHGLVTELASAGITLSTVGIGEDADRTLLQNMAMWGSGMFYFTTNFSQIPQIFTKETMRASKSMLIEEPVQIHQKSRDEALEGVNVSEAPMLLGYVATTPKETAKLVLTSDYGHPIYARWRYGLGKTVAFTSNTKDWAMDWWDWDYFSKFWAQLVRSSISKGSRELIDSRVTVYRQGRKVDAIIDSRTREGLFMDGLDVSVTLMAGKDSGQALDVSQTAPGLYRTSFEMDSYGEYHRLLVVQKMDNETLDTNVTAVIESYSPEYALAGVNEEAFGWIASNGLVDPEVPKVLERSGPRPETSTRLWPILLIMALILLPLDIAARRV